MCGQIGQQRPDDLVCIARERRLQQFVLASEFLVEARAIQAGPLLELSARPEGGLRVQISLPLAATIDPAAVTA